VAVAAVALIAATVLAGNRTGPISIAAVTPKTPKPPTITTVSNVDDLVFFSGYDVVIIVIAKNKIKIFFTIFIFRKIQ
jgi:hypothetical protein